MPTVTSIKVLSLDVSSVSTGWCVLYRGDPKFYGVIKLNKKLSIAEKLVMFKLAIVGIICEHKPDYVVVEETYLKNVKTLKTLMQFVGVLNEACLTLIGKNIQMISPQTVRSKFKLKTKEDVFTFVNNKFKLKMNFEDHNDITDSILQGVYYYNFLKEICND